MHGAVDSPGGAYVYGAIDGLGDKLWRAMDGPRGNQSRHRGTMYGTVDDPGGPILGGTGSPASSEVRSSKFMRIVQWLPKHHELFVG